MFTQSLSSADIWAQNYTCRRKNQVKYYAGQGIVRKIWKMLGDFGKLTYVSGRQGDFKCSNPDHGPA